MRVTVMNRSRVLRLRAVLRSRRRRAVGAQEPQRKRPLSPRNINLGKMKLPVHSSTSSIANRRKDGHTLEMGCDGNRDRCRNGGNLGRGVYPPETIHPQEGERNRVKTTCRVGTTSNAKPDRGLHLRGWRS